MISAAEYIKRILDEKSGNNPDEKFFLMVPRGNKKNFKHRYYRSMDDYILKAIYNRSEYDQIYLQTNG